MTRSRGAGDDRHASRRQPAAAPSTRRVFIAVPLPETSISAIARLVRGIRDEVPGADAVRWVRIEGLHVTVRFLGSVEESSLAALSSLVDEVARSQRGFAITIVGAGAFPSVARPRVLWLRLAQGAEALAAVAAGLAPGLAAHGWPPEERPFRAHLTLARSDGVKAGADTARALVARAGDLEVAFEADSLVLFETVTGRGPARYVPLHEAQFGASRGAEPLESAVPGDTIPATDEPAPPGRKGALRAT